MFLVDSHCHLHLLHPEQEIAAVLKRAEECGIKYILNVSVSLTEFSKMIKLVEVYPNVGVSVGLHPNEQSELADATTLIELADHPKVIAIGETGLDYFRSTGDLDWQRDRFRLHIEVAKQLKLPLIVHTREAKEDTIRVLQEEKAHEVGGVMHCFTEDWETAKKALDMGFYISFSGVVTFKNAITIQEVAKKIPLDRILIETDAPYLAPHPLRGKPNEPAYLRYTAEYLANLCGKTFPDFAEQTTHNFFTLFQGATRPHV
jgi:TatD DNase family protein